MANETEANGETEGRTDETLTEGWKNTTRVPPENETNENQDTNHGTDEASRTNVVARRGTTSQGKKMKRVKREPTVFNKFVQAELARMKEQVRSEPTPTQPGLNLKRQKRRAGRIRGRTITSRSRNQATHEREEGGRNQRD